MNVTLIFIMATTSLLLLLLLKIFHLNKKKLHLYKIYFNSIYTYISSLRQVSVYKNILHNKILNIL